MGQNGNSQTFPAAEITSVTEALENFNHFGGECWSDTRYIIFPREDWRIVENKFKAYQEAKKVRLDQEARTAWRKGEPFSFGVTTHGGWYKPSVGVGLWKIVPQHEHDSSGTQLGMMKIMPSMPYGSYQLYIWEYPITLTLAVDEEPRLSMCASSSWCNSQSWWYEKYYQTNLQKGWLFVDGIDVYEGTVEIINNNKAEKSAANNTKFAEAKAKAIEAGITETQIGQIIKLAGKGKVIIMVNLAVRMVTDQKYDVGFVLQVFTDLRGKSPAVVESYAYLTTHAAEIKLSSVKKAVEKAYAWSYLNSLIPGFGAGYFDEAIEALKLALVNKVPFKNGDTETFDSDLAIKLREAGLAE